MQTTMSNKLIRVKAADYTTVDADYDLLHKGCVRPNGRTIKFLYGHNRDIVLGNVEKLFETDEGLYADIRLADENKSPMLKQAIYEMENGLIDKMSIGFSYEELKYNDNNDKGYFDITGISLYEISMVAIPSNPNTAFLGYVKEEDSSSIDDLLQALDGLVSSINTINN